MDTRNTALRAPPSLSAGMDYSEELLTEVDEPPDCHREDNVLSSWPMPRFNPTFSKAAPNIFPRRESLLTRQLHSEAEHTDEDEIPFSGPQRTLSTNSTCSVASTAELTSDDGHSVPSPAISPPLPPTAMTTGIPIAEKTLAREPVVVGNDGKNSSKKMEICSENSVEAGLGRRRCISFACGGRAKPTPTSQPSIEPQAPPQSAPPATDTASPPKRKCTLKFVCPTRTGSESRPLEKNHPTSKRPVSPPPRERRTSANIKADLRAHRGSDSTVTHPSPKNTRKAHPTAVSAPALASLAVRKTRKLSNDSDASTEATRFHAFGTSDDEPEEWVQESTCHRSRLTVNDTLKKENVIRRACEEVEEEAVEEEEEEEEAIDNDDTLDDELDPEDNEEDCEEDDVDEEEDLSDDGFCTDDEEGFAASDSEGEESEEEWWRPGGPSTAATSIEQLDRILSHQKLNNNTIASSLNSASSGHMSPRMSSRHSKSSRRQHGDAVPIRNLETSDLPDSTDFVCGTLDEDRPLEQAYINNLKLREAARHIVRPQDIDPTFPTSDPEMDEEDDEDLDGPEQSESENFMHGELDELDGNLTARRRLSPQHRARAHTARSPPPPIRHRSPAPQKRQLSHVARSPPPPCRRNLARSPPPRNLFGHSPRRVVSPAPVNRGSSPPNTRRSSLNASQNPDNAHQGFASRSHVTHTASLPRRSSRMLNELETMRPDKDTKPQVDGSSNADTLVLHKRGAIDIVKGLERKRLRRKERLYAKACAKAALKGEKAYKVKPGKGAERMREVGLELQRYHGKGEHILSM